MLEAPYQGSDCLKLRNIIFVQCSDGTFEILGIQDSVSLLSRAKMHGSEYSTLLDH